MTIEIFRISIFFNFCINYANSIIGPPVTCTGPVPKFSEGKYYFHDNGTYLLRLSTSVELALDLHHRSCFQIDISETESLTNETESSDKVTSLFYSMRYVAYQQTYDIRQSYQFGIAEVQSFCRCDCPKGEGFCTYEFGRKECSKGAVCITRYHSEVSSAGCANSGPASLCCEVTVGPYQNRRFKAISLVDPHPQTEMEIEIYAEYENRWTLFRRYRRTILPFKANNLRLNGFENVAEMYVRATVDASRHALKNSDKWYFYEDSPEFRLYDDRRVNGMYERDSNKFGWLRYEKNHWTIANPFVSLYDIQRPLVTDCKGQKYTDIYDMDYDRVLVIKNSTGSINAEPWLGSEVTEKQKFVDTIKLVSSNFGDLKDSSLIVTFKPSAAPTMKLDIKLHQKMSIIAHLYASYLEDFTAQICLDKHHRRYMNVTLIKSYGEFHIEMFRDIAGKKMDLVLSVITKLPFASNYTEIMPLPSFVASSRLVCLYAAEKPKVNRLCKWASFNQEPVLDFELQNPFIITEGKCPGCNLELGSNGFFSFFNPKNWFNGINSFSEGIAMTLEIVLYITLLVIILAIWRKCLYPVVKWALCSEQSYLIEPKSKGEINV